MSKVALILFILCFYPWQLTWAEEWDQLLGFSERKGSFQDNRALISQQNSNSSGLKVVKRLDQEILLLRAERSKRNGDIKQVKRYVEQLQKQQILPPFIRRVEVLKEYAAEFVESPTVFSQYSQSIRFPWHDKSALVAIVLPTTGK